MKNLYYFTFFFISFSLFSIRSQAQWVQSNGAYLPVKFSRGQNYPNPFNPVTTISFSIPSKSYVTLKIFDVLGKEISILVSKEMNPGIYTQQWDATGFPSGVYFYRLEAGSFSETKKLILLR